MDELHDILTDENWQISNFHRLGYDPVEAIDAVRDGIDYHDVEILINKGHSKETAIMLAPFGEKVKS